MSGFMPHKKNPRLFKMSFDFVILFVYILLKQSILMVNEQECTKILNEGEFKFTHEEMLIIGNSLPH